jgi:mono/diheme cytochrome c family protein
MASPPPDRLAGVDRFLAPLTGFAALFFVVALLIGPELIGARQEAAAPGAAAAPARAGKQIFTAERCGGCHTLADAGAAGRSGPNLDELAPDAATVEAKVKSGGGSMPAFDLPAPELQALGEYVANVAGR